MRTVHINPQNMVKPRGYSHAVSVEGTHRTIYIGGQNAVDETGSLVGKGSLLEQTDKVLTNIEKVLAQAGAELKDIVKLNILIVQGQNPTDGFEAFRRRWRAGQDPPAITVAFVAGLGNPEWLVEIDAIAVTPMD